MTHQSVELTGMFYLARHGETEANRARIVQGKSDTPLTELGRQQAEALGRRLQGCSIGAVISSDLPRAVMTADLVQHYVRAPLREQWSEARERSWGTYELQPGELYWSARKEFEQQNPGKEFVAPGGEPLAEVVARAAAVIGRVKGLLVQQHVLVIAHAAFNRELLRHLLHPGHKGAPRYEQDSACLNIIQFGAGDFSLQVHKVNCTQHLQHL